jgi:mRNA-degrading endonuclease toxin of MazEF toxin-antitoxin module
VRNPTTIRRFEQGDLLVVFLPFVPQPKADEAPPRRSVQIGGLWGKRRPVVVASVAGYNRADDLLVALITSEVDKARQRGEHVIRHRSETGLNEDSAIRPRLHQIVKADIHNDHLGTLHAEDRAGMLNMLRKLLGL